MVTGGGRGIGRASALALAASGAKLVLAARSELGEVAREIRGAGGTALTVKTDVRSPGQVEHLFRRAVDVFGRIDILVNSAGVALLKRFEDTTEEEWDMIIDTNLKGVFLCCQQAVKTMEKNGVIINISSGAGKTGLPGLSVYCASKFGVIGLTEALARETPLRVYALCPGGVNTRMHREIFPHENPANLLQPETVAQKILELCLPGCTVRSGESILLY